MSKRVWLGVSVCSVTLCLSEWAKGLSGLPAREGGSAGQASLLVAQAALCFSEATT